MSVYANIVALILLIAAGYFLTVRTWHKKKTLEDFIGKFDKKIDLLVRQIVDDQEKKLSTEQNIQEISDRLLSLAGIVANKIKKDHRSATDDIRRAKTGIVLLVLATIIQIATIVF